MRKRSKRKPVSIAKPLTTGQHDSIVFAPRAHLSMLLGQSYEYDYAASIAGLLNLSVILAHLQNQAELKARFITAQQVMFLLITESRPPDEPEGSILREALNLADCYIGLQNTVEMTRAIKYSERQIAMLKQSSNSET